jgi:hypothetical protein
MHSAPTDSVSSTVRALETHSFYSYLVLGSWTWFVVAPYNSLTPSYSGVQIPWYRSREIDHLAYVLGSISSRDATSTTLCEGGDQGFSRVRIKSAQFLINYPISPNKSIRNLVALADALVGICRMLPGWLL